MAIFLTDRTRVLVQGITGHQGMFNTQDMLRFGTNVVAGVTPGKGGSEVWGVPVYDSVAEAMVHKPNMSVIFVPAPFAKDAGLEALQSGIKTVVAITEHIPVHDAMAMIRYADLVGATVVGPNTPGITSPGKGKVGVMPSQVFAPGDVGVVSRSGTLTYEIVNHITISGRGESTVVGIGGDRVVGLSFIDVLAKFEGDDQTKAIVLVGEIGGDAEERAASYILKSVRKPVVAYIAGRSAPPGKRMGHAGAIISRGTGTADSKVRALEHVGVPVAEFPQNVPTLLGEV